MSNPTDKYGVKMKANRSKQYKTFDTTFPIIYIYISRGTNDLSITVGKESCKIAVRLLQIHNWSTFFLKGSPTSPLSRTIFFTTTWKGSYVFKSFSYPFSLGIFTSNLLFIYFLLLRIQVVIDRTRKKCWWCGVVRGGSVTIRTMKMRK